MKNFLLVALVVGICIRNSIGKEKLKIDLPENFQADFMQTFERVMRSDYPNCKINPEEVFGKIGKEFLKRAGASGLDIDLEDNNRSKRSIDPKTLITTHLGSLATKLGKRSIENDNEPTPAETNERKKRALPQLPAKLGQLKNKIGLGSLVTKLGIGKRSIENDNEPTPAETNERKKRSIDPLTQLKTQLKSKIGLGSLPIIGKRSIENGNEPTPAETNEREKRSLDPLTQLKTQLKTKIGLGSLPIIGKRSIENDNEQLTQLKNKRSIDPLTQLKNKLAGIASKGIGKRSILNDNELTPADSQPSFRRSQGTATELKSKIGPSKGTETEIDRSRERRGAYEMLMDSIDEVKVKRNADEVTLRRNADFDEDVSKRKRRHVLDLLMDSTQSRNMEF